MNAAGTKGNASQELKGFLDLVAGIQSYEKGSFADRIQEQVIRARQNSEWMISALTKSEGDAAWLKSSARQHPLFLAIRIDRLIKHPLFGSSRTAPTASTVSKKF